MSLISTLEALTASQLIQYYPPPEPGAQLEAASTDPAQYMGNPDYLKLLNEQVYRKYAVDVPNQYIATRFAFLSKTWEAGGKPLNLPAPPAYSMFDTQAFDQWWAQINAHLGQDAPPLFFIKPAPLPAPPVIVAPGLPPPPPPAYDGPIGASVANNPGVFSPSATDSYPDGYIYAGPTGVYQKHIYSNPFTVGNVRILWIALMQNPARTGLLPGALALLGAQ